MSESNLLIDPTITIQAETSSVDPDTCKFIVSRTVHPGGPFFFGDRERGGGSPLVERLFALPGVAYVLVADNVVTVGKEPGASWSGLKSAIGTGLRTQLLTGIPAILEATAPAGALERTDAESRAVIQKLLDQEVNRSIASHGGQISIVDVQDGNLFIAMSGGCQGCAASKVTLRQGFEVMLRSVAPEIVNIVDTTDHAAGDTPFYPRTG
jgi:Fe-S cluster biogenesis protein NfuA